MIQLNYRDNRPIYEQVKDGLRKLVISGAMKADEKLPSVRELATSLSINPNTIQKAYRSLEDEGYIYTITGRGSFVSKKEELLSPRFEEQLKKYDEITKELLFMGCDKQTLINHIDSFSKEIEDDKD